MDKKIKTMMNELGDNEFVLPVGFIDQEGVEHRVVKLTPMTGETEEAIADPKVKDNGGKIITTLLASVVSEIGTLPRVTKEMIRELTTIDRDFLLVKNRQVSLGDEVEFVDTCHACGAKNEVNVDLTKIEAKYLQKSEDREQTFELPNGYVDAGGKNHKKITITLPTGRIQERVAQVVRGNVASATTIMLQLITIKLGDLEFINPDVFRKMTKKDRNFISNRLTDIEAGIDFSSVVYCSDCGAEFTTSIPLQSLLGE